MKHSVIKAFTCKLDKREYNPGDTYESSDPERAAYLQGKGPKPLPKGGPRLGAMIDDPPPVEPPADPPVDPPEPPAQEPQHVGGGYYLLPNGEKVKGKEAAIAAMNGGD